MERWRECGRRRRTAMLAAALLAHAVLIGAMLRSRVTHEASVESRVAEATIWLPPPPTPLERTRPLPPPRSGPWPAMSRPTPRPRGEPRAIHAPLLETPPIAQAASAPEAAASAASPPLNLTLSRDQIRALIAQERPTLAQLGPHAAKASPYDRLAGDGDGMTEIELPHGVTEVHLHGECFRLIPTPRAQYDPFNHGGERLTGPCIGNF